jgi:putative RecB family exonuclease
MFINKISNSKFNVWKECKLKYKYKYVDYFPEPDGDNTKALHFGSYIHQVLEDGVNATTLEEMIRHSDDVKGNYKLHPDYDGKETRCFENFLKFNSQLGKTVGTELRYEVDLADGILANGIIDRVIQGEEGGLLVIDYKTSKREKTKIDLFQDAQLQGYVFALSQMMKVPVEKITAAHYYPLTNNFVTVKYSKSQIAGYVKKTVTEVWRVRKSKKEDLTPMRNQYCNWCAFKGVCPQFANPKQIEEGICKLKVLKEEKDKDWKAKK